MPDTTERLLTVEEFLENYPPPGDIRRWQLIDGRPVPMNPAFRRHRVLALFLCEALNRRLTLPCLAETEACIRPLRSRKPSAYYLADAATSCAPVERGIDTPDPVVIAEWLSEDEGEDRKAKLQDYRELPTVQAYLIFEQHRWRVEVHQRWADGTWPSDPEIIQGRDAVLELAAHGGLSIPLSEIYRI
jgi:Uma2 family endonuclease